MFRVKYNINGYTYNQVGNITDINNDYIKLKINGTREPKIIYLSNIKFIYFYNERKTNTESTS